MSILEKLGITPGSECWDEDKCEMLEVLIETLLAAEQYYAPLLIGDNNKGKIQAAIENSTGKSWQEIKEIIGE